MTSRWLLFLLALVLLLHENNAAVMSIDYGTEWFKVGLIKPGLPLDVVLNKDSKRKTQSVVTVRDNERVYGSDAISLAGRFPQYTYFNLKSIIGKQYDDPHCVEYRHRYVNKMIVDVDRHMPLFLHNNTKQVTIEELIAYQFQNAKEQASITAGESVKDVVITVTPFAHQYERQAILDAAELAGLNVLSLMHDETAVALNFAVNRDIGKEPESHIFYDMGAGSTVASIVTFSEVPVKEGKKSPTAPQLEVKSVGYDRTLGGHEFDVRIRQLLADSFMEQNKHRVQEDIRNSDAAMTRLLKEATRVKQILSANTETMASVEGIYNGIDFKVKVTRNQLERVCHDLIDRVRNPILNALEAANMTADDIKSVVLVGGGIRVPSVQNELVGLMGFQKIAKNVNGDEAAVLGAAFRGASLSNQFRLSKRISIKDISLYPIEVSYIPENKGIEAKHPTHTILFRESSLIGVRKVMGFNRVTDFEFEIAHGKDTNAGLNSIGKYKVTGLTEAMKKHKDDIKTTEQPPKVRVSIELTNSGLVQVPEAFLHVKKVTFKDKVKSFFGGKETKNETTSDTDTNNNTDTDKDISTDEPEESVSIIKVPLTIEFIPTEIVPLTEVDKVQAKESIKALDKLDKMKKLREESKNALETFVYRVQDFLYEDIVEIIASEDDIGNFREKLSEISEWLYDEGEHADTPIYVNKLKELQMIEQPIKYRYVEYKERQNNINHIQSIINLSRKFVEDIRAKSEDLRQYTEDEIAVLANMTESVHEWFENTLNAQKKLSERDQPVLTSASVAEKIKSLQEHMKKLLKKKAKLPKKEAKNETEESKEDENKKEETSDKKEDTPEKKSEEDHQHDEL
ncbi:heat shock protein 70 family [Pilobolus umbonatus]|nr:heat shock protein 70 family [Pilobolus umbonatus]